MMANPWEEYQQAAAGSEPAAPAPALPSQNLTVRALRTKGVPDADIATALGNRDRLQLIEQIYRPVSAATPSAAEPLWSGRTSVPPVMLAPPTGPAASTSQEAHGKSDRLPAGLPTWARTPTGNPFLAYSGAVHGTPALTKQDLIANALRTRNVPEADIAGAVNNPERLKQLFQNQAPVPLDKYQQAAIDEIAEMKKQGIPLQNGSNRMLHHGASLGTDNVLGGVVASPKEAYKHGTNVIEGYKYAKAIEDRLLEEARENTGWAGWGLENLGGFATGRILAKGGITAEHFLPAASLPTRVAVGAIDTGARKGFAGAMEGHGFQERATNAAKGVVEGALAGGAAAFLPLGWAALKALFR